MSRSAAAQSRPSKYETPSKKIGAPFQVKLQPSIARPVEASPVDDAELVASLDPSTDVVLAPLDVPPSLDDDALVAVVAPVEEPVEPSAPPSSLPPLLHAASIAASIATRPQVGPRRAMRQR